MADHLKDFEANLAAKNTTTNQVALVVGRIRKTLEGCGFSHWSDISATAKLLKAHFANKMPGASALRVPDKSSRTKILRRDLADARKAWLATAPDEETRRQMEGTSFLCYVDEANRFADFHAFRHATGSFLAAAGVNPKVAQQIMRHSDINLTMSRYSHTYRQDEVSAVEKLPDLSVRPAKDGKVKSA